MSKPNFLLVFSDQHRACDMGCYGNREIFTPNLDSLAKEAVLFSNCISNSPVCVPARGTLLTGLMPDHHRAITNDLPIDPNVESIAHVLNRYNYHTGYIGKWHLGGIPRDKYIPREERLGFTEWKVCNCNHDYLNAYYYDEENNRHSIDGYEPVVQTNLAIEFIERRKDSSPWGLVLSYGPPHDPYFKVPEKYLDLYSERKLTLRNNIGEIINDGTRKLNREDIKKNLKGYYAHISALDEQFGRIVNALKQTGQYENTLLVYVSDHGDMLGSQGYTNKQLPFYESINIPLLISLPGKTTHVASDELISLADLPVSLLGFMGMEFQNERDGHDLSSLFKDPKARGPDHVYIVDLVPCHQAYFRGGVEWRGIKTKTHTYARSYDSKFKVLYDDNHDPYQLHSLWENIELRESLEKTMQDDAKKYDEFLPWEDFIRRRGYLAEWNKSQSYFNQEWGKNRPSFIPLPLLES
jgi:arylsulfatase A-like enzyme